MRGDLKRSLENAIAEAETFKAEHTSWFKNWKYNTAGHRRTKERFLARMLAIDDAINAMRIASKRL